MPIWFIVVQIDHFKHVRVIDVDAIRIEGSSQLSVVQASIVVDVESPEHRGYVLRDAASAHGVAVGHGGDRGAIPQQHRDDVGELALDCEHEHGRAEPIVVGGGGVDEGLSMRSRTRSDGGLARHRIASCDRGGKFFALHPGMWAGRRR